MTTEADLKSEIARLTASINQHKTNASSSSYTSGRGRGGYRGGYASGYSSYGNAPASRGTPRFANNKYVRPGLQTTTTPPSTSTTTVTTATTSTNTVAVPSSSTFKFSSGTPASTTTQPSSSSTTPSGTKDVLIGGVAFESSARSLVRKDLVKSNPVSSAKPPSSGKPPSFPYVRKSGHLVAPGRTYKPKPRRGRNLTLNNWSVNKKRKYLNKPCPRFTSTGACNRGLTCVYQHDPSKIAICWNFLQDNCPNTGETCQLSHDPTPERTPICMHFLNKGRCTRGACPFPHVNVGKREGICRDFAVLGYCEKGLDCDKQHIRECPDFAENGTCSTKGCKLPHVIRANRGRKAAAGLVSDKAMDVVIPMDTNPDSSAKDMPTVYAEDAQLGDEYISLTFHESEESESESEEDNDSDSEADDEDEQEFEEKNSGSE